MEERKLKETLDLTSDILEMKKWASALFGYKLISKKSLKIIERKISSLAKNEGITITDSFETAHRAMEKLRNES